MEGIGGGSGLFVVHKCFLVKFSTNSFILTLPEIKIILIIDPTGEPISNLRLKQYIAGLYLSGRLVAIAT